MKNDIAEYPIPLVFKLIGRRRSSGQLVVSGDGHTRKLVFSQGKLRSVTSDCDRERLVDMMMLAKVLTRDQAVKVKSRLGKRETAKVGRILVEEGMLTEKGLYDCLSAQAGTIAANTFGLLSGTWSFSSGQSDLSSSLPFQISIHRIIISGTKVMNDFSHYRGMFGGCVLKAVKLPEKVKKLLSSFELKFLEHLATMPGKTVNQIVGTLAFTPRTCWREIMKLYLLNGLDFIDTDKWASNTETMIRAQIDLGKTRESRPPAPKAVPLRVPAPEPDPEKTVRTEEEKTRKHATQPPEEPPLIPPEASSSQRSAHVFYHMAERLFQEGKYREAASILNRSVRTESSPAAHILLLGLCKSRVQQMQSEAEFYLKISAEKDPWNPEPHFALGDLYRSRGQISEALVSYQNALKLYQKGEKEEKSSGDAATQVKRKSLFPLRRKFKIE